MDFYILNIDDSTPVYIDEILTAGDDGKMALGKIHICDMRGTEYPKGVAVHRVDGVEFFTDYLEDIMRKGVDTGDQLIPSHDAPHILAKVFKLMLERRGFGIDFVGFKKDIETPFERDLERGIKSMSLATERCPDHCPEPEVCPNTGKTYLDIGKLLEDYSRILDAAFIGFECSTFVGSVATVPVNSISSCWKKMYGNLSSKDGARFLVATHSRCHGIVALIEVSGAQ